MPDINLNIDSGPSAYTDERIRDLVASFVSAGTDVNVTHDDANDTLTIDNTDGYSAEKARDDIADALSGSSGITVTHDDANDTITIDTSALLDGQDFDGQGTSQLSNVQSIDTESLSIGSESPVESFGTGLSVNGTALEASGGTSRASQIIDAAVYPEGTPNTPYTDNDPDYIYDNGGRRGSSGTSTFSDIGAALNQFFLDYNGNTGIPGVCKIAPGLHYVETVISPRRGCIVLGPSTPYDRGVKWKASNDSSEKFEEKCVLDGTQLPGGVMIDVPDETDTGVGDQDDGKGFSIGYLTLAGDIANTGATPPNVDLIRWNNTDTHVVEKVHFMNTNGHAILCSGSFSTEVHQSTFAQCGSETNSKAAIRTEQSPDEANSANLKLIGCFGFADDSEAWTQVNATQSCQIYAGQGRNGFKVANPSPSAKIYVIKGSNLFLRDIAITAEGNANHTGILVDGGEHVYEGVTVEKIEDGIEVNAYSTATTNAWRGLRIQKNVGHGIFSNSTSDSYPDLIGCIIQDNDGDGIRMSSDSRNAPQQIIGCRIVGNGGWGLNDQTGDNRGFCSIIHTKFNNNSSGAIADESLVDFLHGPFPYNNHNFISGTISDSSTSTGNIQHNMTEEPALVQPVLTGATGTNTTAVIDYQLNDTNASGNNDAISFEVDTAPGSGNTVTVEAWVAGQTRVPNLPSGRNTI